jgi:hypothetical protein
MFRTALLVIGCVAILLGLLFIGQGSGYFPYPRSSFMVYETTWIYRGIATAAFGVVLLVMRSS